MIKKAKTPAIYMGANVLSALVPFLLLPIMTTYLTPSDYGVAAMFQVATSLLVATAGISVRGNAVRKYYADPENISYYLGSCTQLLVLFWLVNLLIVFLFGDFLASLVGLNKSYLYMAASCASASMLVQLRLGQWQVRNKAVKYGIFQVIGAMLNASVSVFLVIALLMGPDGRILGVVTSSAIMLVLASVSLARDKLVKFVINESHIREIINFGLPLVPHVLAGSLLVSLDRYFILNTIGADAVGIYMIAFQFGLVISMTLDAINKYYVPVLFSTLADSDFNKNVKMVKATYIGLAMLFVIGFILSYVLKLVLPLIVDPSFHSASNIVPWIVMANCTLGIYFVSINYVIYAGKTKFVSLITISAVSINVLSLLIFLPLFGVIGAAYALLLSNILRSLLAFLFAKKFVSMPWLTFNKSESL